MARENVAEFSLGYKKETFEGTEFHRLVGSFGTGGTKRILVSIPCDSSGNVRTYTSKDGKVFCYAKATSYNKQPGQGSSKRELRL